MEAQSAIKRDCEVLSELLGEERILSGAEPDVGLCQATAGIIWHDLKGKLRKVSPEGWSFSRQFSAMFGGLVPQSAPLALGHGGSNALEQPSVDILIISPLAKELRCCLLPFDTGSEEERDEDDNIEGHKVYFCVDAKKGKKKEATIAISVVNKQRNVPCSLLTDRLLVEFRPKVAFLAGIGGGVRGKVNLGDVIVSTAVIDRAGGCAETDGVKPRHVMLSPLTPMDKQLDYFAVPETGWNDAVRSLSTKLRASPDFRMPDIEAINSANFKIEQGIIVAGEQLIADGSLPELRITVDDRIRSCDMEGSGFAEACQDRDIPWLIFRGISDFGDPNKAECERWHALAAANAAMALRTFIQTQLRFRSEIRSFRLP